MRKTQPEMGPVQMMDAWPPVELFAERIPQEKALRWAEQKIIELKKYNLRFVRAMDVAEVDLERLPEDFLKGFEFLGTADVYLTVTLELLRAGNCRPREIPSLFEAIMSLASSLGEARRQMLSSVAEPLRTQVLDCEEGVCVATSEIEDEMSDLRNEPPVKKRAKATTR